MYRKFMPLDIGNHEFPYGANLPLQHCMLHELTALQVLKGNL